MPTKLTTVPTRFWKALPRSAAEARALGRRYYFSGERCRNGHVALSKVRAGCVVCMGLSKARAEVRLQERIAERELSREGRLRRPKPLRAETAEGRVLIAIAERGGIVLQSELVDPSVRGMSMTAVNRAVRLLLAKKLLQYDRRVYRVTITGWARASGLGAVDPKFG